MTRTLYLCAAGNPEGVRLALEMNEASGRWGRIVLLDDDPAKIGQEILGVRVEGPFAALKDHRAGDEAVNLVARSTRGRDGACAKIERYGISLTSLVHPSLNLRGVTLGRAVTLYEGCTTAALASVGDHSVVFARAVLGHGAVLGAGAVLAPGVVVNARVRVGNRAYIGCNAAVLPDLEIGEDATVSACSAVVADVPAGCTVLGVPAEIIRGGPVPVAPATTHCAGAAGPLDELQAIFAQVLGVPSLGRDVNFFDAGGTSKQALELQVALRERLGLPVTIIDIFRFPNPRQLAVHLTGGSDEASGPARASLRRRRRQVRG